MSTQNSKMSNECDTDVGEFYKMTISVYTRKRSNFFHTDFPKFLEINFELLLEQKKSRRELFSQRWLRAISTDGSRSMPCRQWKRGTICETTTALRLTFTIRTRTSSTPRNTFTFKTARQVRVAFGVLINPIIFHSWLVMNKFIVNISIAKTEKFKRQRCQVSPTQQVRILENSSELYFEAFSAKLKRRDSFFTRQEKCDSCKMIHGMPEMCCVKSRRKISL